MVGQLASLIPISPSLEWKNRRTGAHLQSRELDTICDQWETIRNLPGYRAISLLTLTLSFFCPPTPFFLLSLFFSLLSLTPSPLYISLSLSFSHPFSLVLSTAPSLRLSLSLSLSHSLSLSTFYLHHRFSVLYHRNMDLFWPVLSS